MRRTTALLASLFLLAGGAFAHGVAKPKSAAQPQNNTVSVPLDEVRVVAFDKPISTLYVGNPVIADITMIDKRHAFVLGKAFGATNIIALDAAGAQISNRQVLVFGASASTVTLQKGTTQITYACAASRCQAAPQPGDDKDAFGTAIGQITQHQDLLAKAAASQ